MRAVIAATLVAMGLGQPAAAEGFQTITDKSSFLGVVQGKDLTRLGIKLAVLPSGEIRGNAFGRSVTGAWRWNGDYFCRDLYYGETDLGPNCQLVKVRGNTVRFIADQGSGRSADLRLR